MHRYVEERHADEGTAGGSGWNAANDGRAAEWRAGAKHADAIADAVHVIECAADWSVHGV